MGIGLVFVMPILLFLLIETISRLSLRETLQWAFRPDSGDCLRFNYLWLVLLFLLLYSLLNRLRWACLLTFALTVGLAVIHAGKMLILQQPLLPGDFALTGMVLNVWSSAYFPFDAGQVGWFAFVAAAWASVSLILLPDWRLGRKRRILMGVTAAAGLLYCSWNVTTMASREVAYEQKLTVAWNPDRNHEAGSDQHLGVQNPDYSVSFNYRSFGFLAEFFQNIGKPLDGSAIPAGYSKAEVQRIWREAAGAAPAPPPALPPEERPHVIIVLAESFWDPNLLEGITINPDPLAAFRRITAGDRASAITVVSPIFGGYTCKAEFELLTGIPMGVLPLTEVPHRSHFGAQVPSLPKVFKEQGYHTVAIHPFLPEFWNRNLIFPAIGFDQFLHLGNMRHREVKGKFISDQALASEIIDTVEASAGPAFVLAISMQNHSPYGDRRYGDVEQDIIAVPDSKLDLNAVRDFVHGIRDADAMLDRLTRHFTNSRRPVQLLFLGDHQPNLIPWESRPGSVMQDIKNDALFPGLAVKARYLGHALLWSSRGDRPPTLATPLSMAGLPALVMRQAGMNLPPFYQLSSQVFQKYTVLHRGWGLTGDGKVEIFRETFDDPLLRDYQMISYDLLLGKQYSRNASGERRGEGSLATVN